MPNLHNISISISVSPTAIILGLLLIVLFTFFIYKYTLPKVSKSLTFLLIFLRSMILLLILLLLFEPAVILKKKLLEEPNSLIFIDNSESVVFKDLLKRKTSIENLIHKISSADINPLLFSFGSSVKKISSDSLNKLDFHDLTTDLSQIYDKVEQSKDKVSSVTIISDGIITKGEDPSVKFEKLGIPVFTVGVGDTNKVKDIAISKVLFNRYIYANRPTKIKVFLTNSGYWEKNVVITLKDNSSIVARKTLKLNSNNFNSIIFDYTSKISGDRKLSVSVSKLKSEESYQNNRKVFYLNILKSKLKILIISGSPSEDLAFIENTLKNKKEFEVNSLIQISKNKFAGRQNKTRLIDSADVLILVGFPAKNTPYDLINKISDAIGKKHKPYFISLASGTDYNKLRILNDYLNFNYTRILKRYKNVQPSILDNNNPVFKNNAVNPIGQWNSLPPVKMTNANFTAKVGSKILAEIRINNISMSKPLIISQIVGNSRSFSLLAKDIWKWKLQLANKNSNLFDNFLSNAVKWLSLNSKQKQFNIKTSRRFYTLGEKISFLAEVYDATLSPIENASVDVTIFRNYEKYNLQLNSIGNGLYESTFEANLPGDYTYKAKAVVNNKQIGKAQGSFNIGEVNIELVNTKMNKELLSLLSSGTNGRFYLLKNTNGIIKKLIALKNINTKEKVVSSEIKLWTKSWILYGIIFLFAVEWLIRKRNSML
ncbi:hypothetical protein BMS3Abin04_01725 [bacterium BMS3Abin04]|nr:hypothetical protein BMS3Abin04_01725 [bacterium BMS3Abin04]